MEIQPGTTEEHAIYAALKHVFCGSNVYIRRPERIRDLIHQHQAEGMLPGLITLHGIEKVCGIVRRLLIDRIFEIEEAAKGRFIMAESVTMPVTSTVLPTSPATKPLRTGVSSNDPPTQSSSSVPTEARSKSSNNTSTTVERLTDSLEERAQTKSAAATSIEVVSQSIPKLSTLEYRLPIKAQHRLLNATQACLEYACFEFAQTSQDDFLTRNGWDCPESIELNCFIQHMKKEQRGKTHLKFRKILDEELASSIIQIRHAAVHRQRLSNDGIYSLLEAAVEFLKALKDEPRLAQMKHLQKEVHKILTQLDRREEEAGAALDVQKRAIEARRKELQSLENAAIENAIRIRQHFRAAAADATAYSVDRAIAHNIYAVQHNWVRATLLLSVSAFIDFFWLCVLYFRVSMCKLKVKLPYLKAKAT